MIIHGVKSKKFQKIKTQSATLNFMQSISIIPEPSNIKIEEGIFSFSSEIIISIDSEWKNLGDLISEYLIQDHNIFVKLQPKLDSEKIFISIIKDETLDSIGNEGYNLTINLDNIEIKAKDLKGAFYAIQTLRQLIPHKNEKSKGNSIEIPCAKIVDSPRFKWRGYMLDEGRYFLGKEAVKKVIDWLALFKFNILHWHLTEDQGWRIEIKKYPLLTEVGSKRKGTPKFRNKNKGHDNIPHEGYYSQEDVKEIIAYAAERHVEIIPEIELPGHSQAALAAYPELGCSGKHFEVSSKWGVHKDVYCPGKPKTVEFLKDILTEVLALFPTKYIHIGGDEVPKDRWKICSDCQAKMQQEGLNTEHDLQIHITEEIINWLAEKGRKTIFWDEVTDLRFKENAVVQYWHGKFDSVARYLKNGGEAIISTSNRFYLDVSYNFTPLSEVLDYNPVSDNLDKQAQQNILGFEAEMWGEVFQSLQKVEWCTFPRLLVIAEHAWTQRSQFSKSKFLQKLPSFLTRLDAMDIGHAKPSEYDPSFFQRLKNKFQPHFGYYA
jgi:hexosaminidase